MQIKVAVSTIEPTNDVSISAKFQFKWPHLVRLSPRSTEVNERPACQRTAWTPATAGNGKWKRTENGLAKDKGWHAHGELLDWHYRISTTLQPFRIPIQQRRFESWFKQIASILLIAIVICALKCTDSIQLIRDLSCGSLTQARLLQTKLTTRILGCKQTLSCERRRWMMFFCLNFTLYSYWNSTTGRYL